MRNNGLILLARKGNPRNLRDWEKLINARVELAKKLMESFSLQRLGEVKLGTEYRSTPADQIVDSPVFSSVSFLAQLSIQGFFEIYVRPAIDQDSVGTTKIWGLTRDLEWLIAEVRFKKFLINESLGWKEVAVHTTVKRVKLIDLLREVTHPKGYDKDQYFCQTLISPKRVWDTLGTKIVELNARQQTKACLTAELAGYVAQEQLVYDALSA